MDTGADLIPDLSERGFVGWVFEGPVEALRFSGEYRADFVGVVADGDDVIELLTQEFVDGLGAMAGDVDAELLHDGDGFGAHFRGLRAGGKDIKATARFVTPQAFGHLAAGGVTGAQNQDALLHRKTN